MNSFIEAQRELRDSLRTVHENLALAAFRGIGVEFTTWQEISNNPEAVFAVFEEFKKDAVCSSYEDEWQFTNVVYDPSDIKRQYEVPLQGSAAVSLVESDSPISLSGSGWKGHYGNFIDEVNSVSSGTKFIDLVLRGAKGKKEYATVLLAPDMPASAVHYDDIDYVAGSGNHHFTGTAVIEKVAAAFGEESVEILGPEACLALAAAINNSQAALRSLDCWPQK